jgi:hypothetical protein
MNKKSPPLHITQHKSQLFASQKLILSAKHYIPSASISYGGNEKSSPIGRFAMN